MGNSPFKNINLNQQKPEILLTKENIDENSENTQNQNLIENKCPKSPHMDLNNRTNIVNFKN